MGTDHIGEAAEMIFSGDELLRGDTINSNQAYLGERMLDLGLLPTRALSVIDDLDTLVGAIEESLARRPVVLVLSGGLGPTEDDLTREAVSKALGRPLEHHEELMDAIRARFAYLRLPMGESNRKQASIPQGATVIPLTGTAPGFRVQQQETLVVALPGVPWELKQMWEAAVEPALRERSLSGTTEGRPAHTVRRIRTFRIGESALAELLKEFDWHDPEATIGTRANLDGVTLILRGHATVQGEQKLDAVQERALALLGDRVYGLNGEGLPEIAGELLRSQGLTVAAAESCTGGLVAKRFTDVPGSSGYFLGGVTAYDNLAKIDLLGVPAGMLAEYGAVSEEVAAAMAEGAARLFHADCALSTTGIAGPGGGTDEKPVGLVYLGSVVKGLTEVHKMHFPGQRDQVRERAAFATLDLLRRRLLR